MSSACWFLCPMSLTCHLPKVSVFVSYLFCIVNAPSLPAPVATATGPPPDVEATAVSAPPAATHLLPDVAATAPSFPAPFISSTGPPPNVVATSPSTGPPPDVQATAPSLPAAVVTATGLPPDVQATAPSLPAPVVTVAGPPAPAIIAATAPSLPAPFVTATALPPDVVVTVPSAFPDAAAAAAGCRNIFLDSDVSPQFISVPKNHVYAEAYASAHVKSLTGAMSSINSGESREFCVLVFISYVSNVPLTQSVCFCLLSILHR